MTRGSCPAPMPTRTILYLTPSSRLLGARRSLLQLATHLDPARYRPVVVAQGPGDLVDALRTAGVAVHLHFMGWWRKGRYMILRPFKIAGLARLAEPNPPAAALIVRPGSQDVLPNGAGAKISKGQKRQEQDQSAQPADFEAFALKHDPGHPWKRSNQNRIADLNQSGNTRIQPVCQPGPQG